jgi:hypothetical protein
MDAIPDSTTIPLKTCSKCGCEKPVTPEYWSRHHRGKYGVRGICKACRAERERRRRVEDPSIKERERARRATPHRIAWKKKYMRAYFRSERYKDWDKRRNKTRRDTPAYITYEKRRRQTARYKQTRIAYAKRFYSTPRGKAVMHAKNQRRAALVRALPSDFSAGDWARAVEYFNGRCAVCDRPPGLWHTLAADHWIPLTHPDCPGTVPTNIVPLCHQDGGCNNHKSSKHPEQWLVETFGMRRAGEILERINAFFEWVKE